MGEHTRMSPSGAHRWLKCPGSVAMEEEALAAGAESGSIYADEGSAAHWVAEQVLTRKCPQPSAMIGDRYQGEVRVIEVTREMADHVADYVTRTREQLTPSSVLMVEQRVEILPELSGTVDALIADPVTGLVTVRDLKYGKGVRVDGSDNPQLKLYGIGGFELVRDVMDVKGVRVEIDQPRLDHVSSGLFAVEELEAFRDEAAAAMHQASQPDAELHPGESQCRFCAARAHCPAYARYALEPVMGQPEIVFDDLDVPQPPDPKLLSAEHLGALYGHLAVLEDWVKAIKDRTRHALETGHEVPGWKLVEGRRGARRWTSPDKALKKLRFTLGLKLDEAAPRSVISPTQAEKLLKATTPDWDKRLGDLIEQPAGPPTIAPEADKRPALKLMIEEVTNGNE